jgi:Ca-activated chloride channel family protein
MPTVTDFSFAAPARLWLLVPLLAGAAGLALLLRWRARRSEPYADDELMPSVAPHRAGWRRPAAAAGLVLAIAALTTAFARPQVLAENAHERATVVIALDTSASMLATDVAPDRFTAATDAAKAFIRDLPAQVDVGLVAYNASAALVAAPTAEHEQVVAALDGLNMTGGTAMGDAITTSLRAVLRGVPAGEDDPAARIVLLSDGDSTTGGSVDDAIAAAAAARVPVSTIAYGTPDGVVVSNGRTFQVPVNTATLERVAAGTGGTAYTAATAAELRSVYDDIGTQLVTDTAREDVADVLSGVALVLLLATAVPSLAWFSRLA